MKSCQLDRDNHGYCIVRVKTPLNHELPRYRGMLEDNKFVGIRMQAWREMV
jgi:hypothetical protein